jgi:hypothetical protein
VFIVTKINHKKLYLDRRYHGDRYHGTRRIVQDCIFFWVLIGGTDITDTDMILFS